MLLGIAKDSLFSRKKTLVLTFISLTISMLVLFSVEHLRLQVKESFQRTNSGTDLIVGAPSGQISLLLYSVFRIGQPTNDISYQSFEVLNNHAAINWAIPLALGDSHRGFRVLGTDNSYFEHYGYGEKQSLKFLKGGQFNDLFDVVLGADVAEQLNYKLGDKVVVSHGVGTTSFSHHKHAPLTVTGILHPTGTPIDKTIHVTLDAITAIHLSPAQLSKRLALKGKITMTPTHISAVMLGLKSKMMVFKMQRDINKYQSDRLMAILPGVAMSELWQLTSGVENALIIIAALVVLSSFCGLTTMLLASINERKMEISIYRMLGARPKQITLLIVMEAMLIACTAMITSLALLASGLTIFKSVLATKFGLFIESFVFSESLLFLILALCIAAMLSAILPATALYHSIKQQSLSP